MSQKVLTPPPPSAPIGHVSVEQEMRKSYIDYAMSVIVSRALPDVRDGLKPVHRRILYGATRGGYTSDKKLVKSARIVGDVMGLFHPHGDAAIYDAMVRMVQPFSMRVPLIQGQGNFGSPDGDPPAAMRYTEARMARIADEAMVEDIDDGTVDWRPNYDGSTEEPVVLPARFPNLLVNGGEGIAVGMATKIAPHNLGEVIDATLAMLANADISLDELMKLLPGPDFPTGGIILGRAGIRDAFETGRGMITMSSVYDIEPGRGGRQLIVVTEFPYQVNKTEFLEKVADLVGEKTIEGIANLRDESDERVRVVIELKRDASPELVLNKLKKHTDFVRRFNVNATCLDGRGNPRIMGLTEILREFIAFRRLTVRRRTEFRLNAARDALTIHLGLFAARSNIDEVIRRVRGSANREAAMAALMDMSFPCQGELAVLLHETDPDVELPDVFHLSQAQAKTILEMRIQALTALEQEAIATKAREILATIAELEAILQSSEVLDGVIRTEMEAVRAKYNTQRLTRIELGELDELSDDDLVEDKPVVLTMTRQGYVKITPLQSYREQSRGGKGKTGMDTKDNDFVVSTVVCSTRTNLIFFTSRGIAHTLKAYKLPEAAPNAKGRPLINFIQLRQNETVATVMPMPAADELEGRYMVFVTNHGDVRRNDASEFALVNRGGKIAMRLEDQVGNQIASLIAVLSCTADDDIVLGTRWGRAVRFPVNEIRVFKGRGSTGVAGIHLAEGDEVISGSTLRHFEATAQERDAYFAGGTTMVPNLETKELVEFTLAPERMEDMRRAEQTLMTVTENGYGKRFSSHDFRTTGRGAHGVWVGQFNKATGSLAGVFPVKSSDGLILITNGGQTIRTRCSEIRVMGRPTRGVRLFDLPDGQKIVDVAVIDADEDA